MLGKIIGGKNTGWTGSDYYYIIGLCLGHKKILTLAVSINNED